MALVDQSRRLIHFVEIELVAQPSRHTRLDGEVCHGRRYIVSGFWGGIMLFPTDSLVKGCLCFIGTSLGRWKLAVAARSVLLLTSTAVSWARLFRMLSLAVLSLQAGRGWKIEMHTGV